MEYLRAVVGGGVIAGLVLLAGAWWSRGANADVADTRVLVGAGRLEAPDPGAVALEEDRLRELVAALTRRARELDAREESLAAREVMLRELELAFASSTAAAEAATDPAADGRLRGGVAEIYASMPAEEAAPILDRLDDDTLRAVFGPMEPPRIAAILAAMDPERAVAFTRALATDAPDAR
jgi:flagellar motility protein MotE (MotC chaperone)